MLKEKIDENLISALKSQDEVTTSVLRMLKSAIKNQEINLKRDLNDEEVINVIQAQIKLHDDSIRLYKSGGREELAQKEEDENEILKHYLPQQMSEDEIRGIVQEIITRINASTIKDMGRVMAEAKAQIKNRASGALIAQIVKEELTQ